MRRFGGTYLASTVICTYYYMASVVRIQIGSYLETENENKKIWLHHFSSLDHSECPYKNYSQKLFPEPQTLQIYNFFYLVYNYLVCNFKGPSH